MARSKKYLKRKGGHIRESERDDFGFSPELLDAIRDQKRRSQYQEDAMPKRSSDELEYQA